MHTIARSRTKSEAGNKSQFINLLDYYSDEPRPMDFLPIAEAPNWRQPYTEDTSDIESPERTSTKWVPRDEHEKNAIRAVGKAITNIKTSEDSLFELYRTLPAPRASFLTPGKLHKLLHRLSVVERKSETTMLRFFSVIDDMRTSGIPLTTNEWNSAIAFAGRHNTRVSDRQIESALQIWKNMEEGSKKKGTEVTFNILYDVASRAGKFGLASMIKEEMKAQKMPKTRFNFVSTIQACGFQGDAQGVRDTYRQMVEEGEIIDTAVLNTVISAIIRCGEPTAAEQIYERMKRLHASRTESTSPRHSWREARTLGRYLKKAALQTREDPALRKTVQDQISISPDLRTYRILVLYHCMVSGRLDRVATLVDEMRSYRVPLHGSIFLYLFKGFTRHGGVRYTDWTVEALERVWTAYMSALGHEEGVVLGKWIFVWALRAFSKISDKERVESIWASVREHRHASKEELQAAELLLHSISK
jgi:pentatricopeptide repeat protein